MKRFLVLVAFSSLFSLPLTAQDPKLILFGGFQYLRDGNADGFGDRINASGWNASAAFQFNKHFGVAADFSGSYRSTNLINASLGSGGQFPVVFRAYTYSFGPVFTWNAGGKIRPFAHALLGGAHLRPNGCAIFSGSPDECGSGSYGGFTMMLG